MIKSYEDIRLKTLASLPTIISGVKIFPKSLKCIAELGYDRYLSYLNSIILTKEILISPESLNEIPEDINIYDIMFILYQESSLGETYKLALEYFLEGSVSYENEKLVTNGIEINKSMYQSIIDTIKIQNAVKLTDNREDFNPKNDRVKRLREKMLENKKKIQELKKNSGNDEEQLVFFDLVSILSSNANGINIFNVFDLNMLQFNDQFNRMKLLNDYEINVQALLHGANSKDIEIKHWISRSQI